MTYNPYNIPAIHLANPEDFTADAAMRGTPPTFPGSKAGSVIVGRNGGIWSDARII
jgi:hypothetical protein